MSSDMLREVSDSLFEHLIEAFPPDRPYSRSDIEQDPMPPLLAHFLGQSLQYKLDIEVEHLRTVRSQWFNYNHPDVQSTYKAFIASLAQHTHIPTEEWRASLKRASKLVIAHLVLPTHTLVEYVFHDDDGPLLAPIIYRELSYFAAYPYLREAVEAFLKQRQLKELDRARFSSLLMQIDKHMTANYSPNDWMRMLRPMFDLMRRIPLTINQGAPIDLLAMFFGDKDVYDVQERLYVEKEVLRANMINESSLFKVIEGSVEPFEQKLVSTKRPPQAEPAETQPQAPAPSPPPAATPVESKTEEQAAEEIFPAHPPSPPSLPKEVPAPEPTNEEPLVPSEEPASQPITAQQETRPRWQQFQQTATEEHQETQPQNGVDDLEGDQKNQDAIPLWMQFQQKKEKTPADPHTATPQAQHVPAQPSSPYIGTPVQSVSAGATQPVTPIPSNPIQHTPRAKPKPLTLEQLEFSVLGLYGSTNRNLFIEHLFAGSEDQYKHLLNQLHNLENWQSASQLIAEEIFKKNNVNIYSPAAIMFTESVEEQYNI